MEDWTGTTLDIWTGLLQRNKWSQKEWWKCIYLGREDLPTASRQRSSLTLPLVMVPNRVTVCHLGNLAPKMALRHSANVDRVGQVFDRTLFSRGSCHDTLRRLHTWQSNWDTVWTTSAVADQGRTSRHEPVPATRVSLPSYKHLHLRERLSHV